MTDPAIPNQVPKTWLDRTAENLADIAIGQEQRDNAAQLIKAAMEACAEMKCVALKVALARCYELISLAKANTAPPNPDSDFLDSILELVEKE